MGPSLDDALYQQAFIVVLEALLPFFDQDVQEMLLIVAKKLQEGYPCPASQVAAGSLCCGSLVATCVEHIVRGAIIAPFPKFHYINLHRTLESTADPLLK
ncbi:Putative ThiF family adenylyltransferase [Candidatus Bealeia paramacronuclearis]|uniref:ThiF family adenylyltransferase n=1 Tax=Candidatus Bealeia paramacronuclearis TaxID=1921001 RepID=A0ABZ2C7W4_9PROT|nr:putative ThiF family adenylyltransferase [Candidatus Bealeia paramacronuclearis]